MKIINDSSYKDTSDVEVHKTNNDSYNGAVSASGRTFSLGNVVKGRIIGVV